jgi:signal transduction histidine kinase
MSDQLEQTISELKSANVELQKDNERKTQIDEMRKEFLNNVSHELKTPIALISGYAEGLKDNIAEDKESRDFYCDVIIDESSKMNNMVRKLLTLNQLEFGNDQVTMERFDITQLVKGVISGMKLLIEDKGAEVTINTDEPVYVWGDEFKIEEVVTNYMSNALNHLDYDKKIDVRIKRENGLVRVSVFNTGNPIPEGDIDKIWDKFYKVDKARTREYGGSGIGLSIVKAIMESHNQQCGVKNYEDGVQFWFTLEGK